MNYQIADQPVTIIGAGPAGLCAGYELKRRGIRSEIFEKGTVVGGLARTETYRGFRFDIGGHRFYTKSALVEQIWREVLGDDLLVRQRFNCATCRHWSRWPVSGIAPSFPCPWTFLPR